jgi:hypothetical protein
LKRLVPLAQFSSYDHELVKKLFFGASDETDTDRVRAHYRSSGFRTRRESSKPFFQQKLDALPELRRQVGQALDVAAGAPLPSRPRRRHPGSRRLPPDRSGQCDRDGDRPLDPVGVAAGCAYAYQGAWIATSWMSPLFLWAPLLLLYLAWLGYRDPSPAVPWRVAGVFLMRLAIVITVFLLIQTRSGPKRIARRKALVAARRYFRRELGRTEPRLSDAWFPYVVAFGLTSTRIAGSGRTERLRDPPGAAGRAAARALVILPPPPPPPGRAEAVPSEAPGLRRPGPRRRARSPRGSRPPRPAAAAAEAEAAPAAAGGGGLVTRVAGS